MAQLSALGSVCQLRVSTFLSCWDNAVASVCQQLLGRLLAYLEQADTGIQRLIRRPCLQSDFLVSRSFGIFKLRFGSKFLKIKIKISFSLLKIIFLLVFPNR